MANAAGIRAHGIGQSAKGSSSVAAKSFACTPLSVRLQPVMRQSTPKTSRAAAVSVPCTVRAFGWYCQPQKSVPRNFSLSSSFIFAPQMVIYGRKMLQSRMPQRKTAAKSAQSASGAPNFSTFSLVLPSPPR